MLEDARSANYKSIRYDIFNKLDNDISVEIKGKKKRVFFDYDMEVFLDELSATGNT